MSNRRMPKEDRIPMFALRTSPRLPNGPSSRNGSPRDIGKPPSHEASADQRSLRCPPRVGRSRTTRPIHCPQSVRGGKNDDGIPRRHRHLPLPAQPQNQPQLHGFHPHRFPGRHHPAPWKCECRSKTAKDDQTRCRCFPNSSFAIRHSAFGLPRRHPPNSLPRNGAASSSKSGTPTR